MPWVWETFGGSLISATGAEEVRKQTGNRKPFLFILCMLEVFKAGAKFNLKHFFFLERFWLWFTQELG